MRSRAEEKSMETSLYKTAGVPCGKRGGQREREREREPVPRTPLRLFCCELSKT